MQLRFLQYLLLAVIPDFKRQASLHARLGPALPSQKTSFAQPTPR
jgi:hypothetical protein